MAKISRRKFVKKIIGTSSGIVLMGSTDPLMSSHNNMNICSNNLQVFIPMPVQVVIDDVGWWSGKDGSKTQEPYRTGINRNHVPEDYKAIVDLGKALNIRPQAAFIVCEWDKNNILRNLPTSTWMGEKWDNSSWVGQWLDEAAEIIRNNRKYFELTVHGIGHEYWEAGTFTRAEWTDSNGKMRPPDQVKLHLDYFEKILNQHNLGPFPESFVPAAFRHSFGPSEGRIISLAELLKEHGINYINTPFSSMYNKERVQFEHFGSDAGVMTIDRGNDEFPWLTFPANPVKDLTGPTCGLHWPNMLHPNPERNAEVVKRWINYLKPINEKKDMMLAQDSVSFQHQLIHHSLTRAQPKNNSIEIDFSESDKLPESAKNEEIILKLLSDKPLKVKSDGIKIISQSLLEGTEFIYTLKLGRLAGNVRAQLRLG